MARMARPTPTGTFTKQTGHVYLRLAAYTVQHHAGDSCNCEWSLEVSAPRQ
jgi:hypothetical protein